jgi:hypothetical protein
MRRELLGAIQRANRRAGIPQPALQLREIQQGLGVTAAFVDPVEQGPCLIDLEGDQEQPGPAQQGVRIFGDVGFHGGHHFFGRGLVHEIEVHERELLPEPRRIEAGRILQ